MEATNYSCKILIVGGSVAGLALANMLERVGIDFVVLEAGSKIDPSVGGVFLCSHRCLEYSIR